MRRAIAVLMLLCLGMMVPLAAAPLRICVMNGQIAKPSCCAKCHPEPGQESKCCLKWEQPDTSLPGIPATLPPAVAIDLPLPVFMLPPVELLPSVADGYFQPIRGPDTPCRHRATLGVWRL